MSTLSPPMLHTEANARHDGRRNSLGCRDLTNWLGDARPEPTPAVAHEPTQPTGGTNDG